MVKANAQTVAKLLREYAQRTALRGGNPYRAKAYFRAADSLAALAIPPERVIADGRLTEIPGIGEAIADIVTKLHRTGTHPSLEKLRSETPAGVLELLAIPGLRPEKVLRLYEDLGITSLSELESAAKGDRIKKARASEQRCRRRSCRTCRSPRAVKGGFTCIAPRRCWNMRGRRWRARIQN